ncbi:MAG: hypothetical protein HUJ26_14925 [Planctomycetaceae bacterium]|nr:hypothetical protein [Planctomycetaceae bacterium]
MPKLEANDVPHTAQTDHRILRQPSQTSQSDVDSEISVYQESRLAPEVIDRDSAVFMVRQAEAINDKVLANLTIPKLVSWVDEHPQDAETLSILGTAYAITGVNNTEAIIALEKALKFNSQSEYTLRQLTYLFHDLGDLETAAAYGEKLLGLNDSEYQYLGRMAHILGRLKRMDEAIKYGAKAAELQPWNFQIQGWLTEAYRLTNQPEKAEYHRILYEATRPRGEALEKD